MSSDDVIELGHQPERTLENIRQVLITKIPSYIESRRRKLLQESSEIDTVSYRILDCHVTLLSPSNSVRNLSSDIYRAEIETEENKIKENGEINQKHVRKESLIVKKYAMNSGVRDMQDSSHLFYVESKMFSDVIPLFHSTLSPISGDSDSGYSSSNLRKAYSLFPKCYYTSPKCKDSLIVLEDLENSGYRIGENDSLLMDFDHIVLALEGLARFHALSYAMKKKDPQGFYGHVVQKLKKGKKLCSEDKTRELMYAHAYFQCLQFAALQPLEVFAMEHLKGSGKYGSCVERLNTLLEDTVGLIRNLLIPKEPLSVLCHGNFNMKNILFLYDSSNKPVAVKFTDFRNVHYASPAIDLSLFLFLNASPELRAANWVDFFSIYHKTLLKAISEFLECPEEELLPEYSIGAFKEEFSKHAVYGYVVTAGCVTSALSKRVKIQKIFEMFSNGFSSRENVDNCIKENLKLEGEEVTSRLVSLIKELVDEGYL
ncbi:hypothetical protein B7P43_G10623 [Cryptotermes secundus]|uniref:CHK kinase-like domain-containing protein n=1 Tax=Cryptotermes secundus TaxID=105785 RepID=A0A2J7QXC9_9NEOP|nr:uncharacterized protein LOC111864723 [Cryptotermes secundus]PNF33245.1 hypothetical protein B7P43_G10623 [Cryptotermes secundus]